MTRAACMLLAAGTLAAGCVDPNDPAVNPKAAHALGGWQDLLAPEAMDGWRLTPTYRGAKPWKLADGAFEGTDSWIGHERLLGDFILEGELLFNGRSQGGIVIRGDRDAAAPWVGGYELDIDWAPDRKHGHIHFPGYPEPYAGSALLEVGRWHRFRVEARGTKVRVALDGRQAIRFTDDRFRYGHICLEGESGGVKYRRLRVIGLDAAEPGGPRSPWTDLFDGKTMTGWLRVAGRASIGRGGMRLGRADGTSTVLLKDGGFRNGMVEFDVRRRGGQEASSYSFGLRCGGGLAWQSVYVVCRREQVGACRGSARKQFPALEATAKIEPTDWPERWRIVLNEGLVEVHRFGKKVLAYRDVDPQGGGIGITADRCMLEVRAVRYRPLRK